MLVYLFIFLASQNPNLRDYENSLPAHDKILREVDNYRVRDLSIQNNPFLMHKKRT
jgi:hypothetical protein